MVDSSNAQIPKTLSKGKTQFDLVKDWLVRLIYPPLCMACGDETQSENGLCAGCWASAHFITGAKCDTCCAPVMGETRDEILICDSCAHSLPPWQKGRAALLYEGSGRQIVLALKHSDRQELVPGMSDWMRRAGEDIIAKSDLLVCVPLHWTRLFGRRFNQAAVLAKSIAKKEKRRFIPDVLLRKKRTYPQIGMNREERRQNQKGAISLNPRYADEVRDKHVVLIDDVLTTGATLSACTKVLLDAGAASVNILVFARVARGE